MYPTLGQRRQNLKTWVAEAEKADNKNYQNYINRRRKVKVRCVSKKPVDWLLDCARNNPTMRATASDKDGNDAFHSQGRVQRSTSTFNVKLQQSTWTSLPAHECGKSYAFATSGYYLMGRARSWDSHHPAHLPSWAMCCYLFDDARAFWLAST
jgi:hypothetical protein